MGEGNQKYFIGFLIFQGIMCLYGAYIGLTVIMKIVRVNDLTRATFRNPVTGEEYPATFGTIFFYFFTNYDMLTFLTILCSVMGFCVVFFSVYNIMIVRDGVTSNEKTKISTVMAANYAEFEQGREILRDKNRPQSERQAAHERLEFINNSADIVSKMYKPDLRKHIKEMLAE